MFEMFEMFDMNVDLGGNTADDERVKMYYTMAVIKTKRSRKCV